MRKLNDQWVLRNNILKQMHDCTDEIYRLLGAEIIDVDAIWVLEKTRAVLLERYTKAV